MFWLLKSIYVRLILLVFLQIWIYKKTGMTMMSLMLSIFLHVLYLFYDVLPTFGGAKTLTKKTSRKKKKKKTCSENKLTQKSIHVPCIDQLREELSCAMCFELFFEPSTTPCGHSFCKICLQSTANKWRNCPNCKQSISNEGTFPVNTTLWNTIQLLFPKEIEVRKVADYSLNNRPET